MHTNKMATKVRFITIVLSLAITGSSWATIPDTLEKKTTTSTSQAQGTATEDAPSSIPASEAFLQQVRISSRWQAAEAAFNLSVIAAGHDDMPLAHTLIEEALQLNPSDPNYLRAAAGIAFATREYDIAETHLLKLLELARSTPETEQGKIATVLDELSMIYLAQDRPLEAENALKQGLQIREQALGEKHPSLAGTLSHLAGFAMTAGRFQEAEQLLQRTLHILENSLGTDHSETAMALHNLADLYSNQQRFPEAENYYRQAATIWKVIPAEQRLELTAALNELGSFYLSERRLNEAQPQFNLVLSLLAEDFDQDHPHIRTARDGLKILEQAQQKRGEVEELSQNIFDELQMQLSGEKSQRP